MSKLELWAEAKMKAKHYTDTEKQLRKEICEDIFKGKMGEFNTQVMFDGVMVKATSKLSYHLDKNAFQSIFADMNETEKEAIRYTPAINMRQYRKLPEESILNEIIEVRPALPTLEILV